MGILHKNVFWSIVVVAFFSFYSFGFCFVLWPHDMCVSSFFYFFFVSLVSIPSLVSEVVKTLYGLDRFCYCVTQCCCCLLFLLLLSTDQFKPIDSRQIKCFNGFVRLLGMANGGGPITKATNGQKIVRAC